MKNSTELLNRIAFSADLPGECIPRMPLVEIAGEQRVLIENHRGVAAYGCNEIKIRVSYGIVAVSGSDLQLVRVSKEHLIVAGRIDAVLLQRGCC